MENMNNIGLAFLLTTVAGLSTGIGSSLAFFIKHPKMTYLSFSLGLSGGVMIYISFMELLPEGMNNLGEIWGIIAFFVGFIFIGIIDRFIPEAENPHDFKEYSDNNINNITNNRTLMRTGVLTALAIGIHNFPEGLAAFGTTLNNPKMGVMVALAIAIHNIPEGISVSVPIYYATGNRKKAFTYSFLSGLSEPVGAAIGFLILLPLVSTPFFSALLPFIAGIMVFISLDELLPMAKNFGYGHIAIYGIATGMLVMALSLLMF